MLLFCEAADGLRMPRVPQRTAAGRAGADGREIRAFGVLQGVVDRAKRAGQACAELFGAQHRARFEVLDIIHPAGRSWIKVLCQEKGPASFLEAWPFYSPFCPSIEIAVNR